MTSKSGQTRASGEKASRDEASKEVEKLDDLTDIEERDLDAMTRFRTPGFARLRVDWRSEEGRAMTMLSGAVENRVRENFRDAFAIMEDVYAAVREPEIDGAGNVKRDIEGKVVWRRTQSGDYLENWSALTMRQKEDFMMRITARLFDWEQKAANVWGEALIAKAQWEERFSIAYDAPMSGTIEDRTARAKIDAADERYFGAALALYSKRADAIVRSMSLLSQRIKDAVV
jgi:hypothetical protein